jgi:hypothetical protein
METVEGLFATIPFVNFSWRTDLCNPYAKIEHALSLNIINRFNYLVDKLGVDSEDSDICCETLKDMAKMVDAIIPVMSLGDVRQRLGSVRIELMGKTGYDLSSKRYGRIVDAFTVAVVLDRCLASNKSCSEPWDIRQSLHPWSANDTEDYDVSHDYEAHQKNIKQLQLSYELAEAAFGENLWQEVSKGAEAGVVGLTWVTTSVTAQSYLLQIVSNILMFSNGLLVLSKVSIQVNICMFTGLIMFPIGFQGRKKNFIRDAIGLIECAFFLVFVERGG